MKWCRAVCADVFRGLWRRAGPCQPVSSVASVGGSSAKPGAVCDRGASVVGGVAPRGVPLSSRALLLSLRTRAPREPLGKSRPTPINEGE